LLMLKKLRLPTAQARRFQVAGNKNLMLFS
jgi:hypothetical protein